MFRASEAERLAHFEDRRMWRLLLARLHPDAGGDHDLFAFACAIRDEVSDRSSVARGSGVGGSAGGGSQRVQDQSASFLQNWQQAMDHWSSGNHDAFKNFRMR